MIIRTGNTARRSLIATIKAGAGLGVMGLAAWMVALSMPVSALAGSTVIYDSTYTNLPPNVASLGFQATSTSELGDQIILGGADRVVQDVTVTMSNWALFSTYANDARYNGNTETWSHPVTLNIYDDEVDEDGIPTTLLGTQTKEISIPWRPEASEGCGSAWRAADASCYNGIAFNTSFDVSSLNIVLTDTVIVAIAYSTANYGEAPLGVEGPYNSLNVGIPTGQGASVGSDVNADALFWDTIYPGYTSGLREDFDWAPNGTMSLKITASPALPDTKDECKKDQWRAYGTTFKNQGSCVSYVQTGKFQQ